MLKIISMFIGIVAMMVGTIIAASMVLEEKIKVNKGKLVLLVIISSIFYTLTTIYLTGVTKTIINCILQFITFKYLFKINNQKSIIFTILYVILLILPEIIEVSLFTTLMSKEYFYNNFAGGLLSNLVICILFLIEVIILKKYLKKIINYEINNNIKIVLYSILSLISVLIVFYDAFSDIEFNINLIVSIFTMIVFIGILLNLLKQMVNNSKLIRKYEQILEFMTTYEDEVEKQRILRHETKNAFLSIKAQLTDKAETKEIINYIDSILEDDVKIKNEEYAKFKYLPANGIKGLCYYKIQEAENRNIKVSINISSRIKKSSLSKLSVKEIKELGKILGVYLDNAIEASVKSEDKKLGFEAYLIDNKVKIIISNTYKGELEKEKIGNETYSTKGKNRGHGLLLVKEIVNNNKMFNVENEITDNLYIQSLTIKK